MIKPKTTKLRKLKKLLKEDGIFYHPGSRHPTFRSVDGRKYPIPARSDADDVELCYVDGTRRRFNLTPDDGISDEVFYKVKKKKKQK